VSALERLRGGLVVSVQAEATSPLNASDALAMLASVAVANGAAGVRAEGSARIGAIRRAVGVPVIGLVKRAYRGFAPYITATAREVAEAVAAGADIVAFDATGRARPDGRSDEAVVRDIHARGKLAMADCAAPPDVARAAAAGADIVGTTMCGYTAETAGTPLPAIDLVRACAASGSFAIAEGGVMSPDEVRAAFAAGAACVVVGTAITNVDALVRRFAAASRRATERVHPIEVLADGSQRTS